MFDGGADGFETVVRIVKKPIAGVCSVADLMAEEGHQWPLSGRAYNKFKMNLGDEDVKRRKYEIFGCAGVIV